MSLEVEFLSMMADTLSLFQSTGVDPYGAHSYPGTANSTWRCRIQNKTEMIRMPDGREVVVNGKAYIYGTSPAKIGDKIVLTDGSSPVLVAVDNENDATGNHHQIIFFGSNVKGNA